MTIETNSHQSLSERARLGVAPSRRIDVDPWGHAPDVARDVHVQTSDAYQTPDQMHQRLAQERRDHLFDPHAKAIDELGARAGRHAGVYDEARDLMSISDKKPKNLADPRDL